jgi:hypothetical protein
LELLLAINARTSPAQLLLNAAFIGREAQTTVRHVTKPNFISLLFCQRIALYICSVNY